MTNVISGMIWTNLAVRSVHGGIPLHRFSVSIAVQSIHQPPACLACVGFRRSISRPPSLPSLPHADSPFIIVSVTSAEVNNHTRRPAAAAAAVTMVTTGARDVTRCSSTAAVHGTAGQGSVIAQ